MTIKQWKEKYNSCLNKKIILEKISDDLEKTDEDRKSISINLRKKVYNGYEYDFINGLDLEQNRKIVDEIEEILRDNLKKAQEEYKNMLETNDIVDNIEVGKYLNLSEEKIIKEN